jgi:RimJ/RimL family protein N-acetyltransferase
MPGPVFLRGDGVELRTIERDDAAFVQRAGNEPAFHEGFVIDRPKTRESTEAHLDRTVDDDDTVSLLICVDGDPVGRASLLDVGRTHADLSYWLVPEARGNGYVTEAAALLVEHAFESLGLHHVRAWTLDDNEASRGVLRRLGFSHEGSIREHVFTRGEYHDVEHFGILDREWDGLNAVLDD